MLYPTLDGCMVQKGRGAMRVCYNKLWKLLIDKGMYRTDLAREAGVTTNAMAHLGKNEDVRVEVLVKICAVLNCTMNDIMELLPDENVPEGGGES